MVYVYQSDAVVQTGHELRIYRLWPHNGSLIRAQVHIICEFIQYQTCSNTMHLGDKCCINHYLTFQWGTLDDSDVSTFLHYSICVNI